MMFQRVDRFIPFGMLEHGNNPWDLTDSITGFDIVEILEKIK